MKKFGAIIGITMFIFTIGLFGYGVNANKQEQDNDTIAFYDQVIEEEGLTVESVGKISCTRCAIIGCFRGKLSETDKIVVDDFVDTYEMYVNSKDDDESDSYFQECHRILVTLVRMTQNDKEYENLIRVTDSLLYI